MENELLLFDRVEVIKTANAKYDLEGKGYLSFSGGKDSTVLHDLLDVALPNNRIPRVYIDTGIEYADIRTFVMGLAAKDPRFVIVKPTKPIKKVLETYGYPFKSKEHSLRVQQFNKGTNANYIKKYLTGYSVNGKPSTFVCPKCLLYQFAERGKYNYSNLCCQKLKKEPAHAWEKKNGKTIAITGMRSEEGGNRKRLGCIISDGKGGIKRFHPLIKVSESFEDWFIERERESNCVAFITRRSTSRGRVAKDARSPSTSKSNSRSWRIICLRSGNNAKRYGEKYMTNIGGSDTDSRNTSN